MRVPDLATERVKLSPYRVGELDNIFRLCSLPETSEYALWQPHRSRYDTLRFILWAKRDPSGMHWCVRDARNGEFIGTCSFIEIDRAAGSAELGYSVYKPFWGNGYAAEMCRAMIRYAFERLKLDEVTARVMSGNQRSVRVLQKLGFAAAGGVERVKVGDAEREVLKFSLKREE